MEKHGYDSHYKGYFEAFTREWALERDLSKSEIGIEGIKNMNTNLHVMEAYTNLYRVWKLETLKVKLEELIAVTINKIIDSKSFHFNLFFDEDWTVKSNIESYGHDIEGSWLLYEAAEVLEDSKVIDKVKEMTIKMAEVTYNVAIAEDGSLLYEGRNGEIIDSDRYWLPQAEAVVGFINAHSLTGEERYLNAAINCFIYIKEKIVDNILGEWFSRVSPKGVPYFEDTKVNPWKCPYHNGRLCFELITRID